MSIIKVSWDEIAERVKAVNPEAFEILDNDPDIRNHYFEIWQYKYGDMVGDVHSHYLPDGTGVRENIPFGMFLSKQFDFYINNNPIKIFMSFTAGDFIYTSYITKDNFSYFAPSNFWISAGTIQPIFACRVADDKKHRRFHEHYNKHIARPYTNSLHLETIREISKLTDSNWRAEFLCFPKKWASKVRESKAHPFKDLIHLYAFKRTAYSRYTEYYQYFLSSIRRSYTDSIFHSAYTSQMVLHIFSALCDHTPIHSLATDETSLPLHDIQRAYLDIYKTEQAPFILAPSIFCRNAHKIHYFSTSHHTESYRPNSVNNSLKICSDIKYIFEIYADTFKKVNKHTLITISFLTLHKISKLILFMNVKAACINKEKPIY